MSTKNNTILTNEQLEAVISAVINHLQAEGIDSTLKEVLVPGETREQGLQRCWEYITKFLTQKSNGFEFVGSSGKQLVYINAQANLKITVDWYKDGKYKVISEKTINAGWWSRKTYKFNILELTTPLEKTFPLLREVGIDRGLSSAKKKEKKMAKEAKKETIIDAEVTPQPA